MTPEHEKAKAWRESHNLSVPEISELTGYSVAAIYWFERGLMAPGRKGENPRDMNPWSWQRYKRLCHSVDVELKGGAKFNWARAKNDAADFPLAQE